MKNKRLATFSFLMLTLGSLWFLSGCRGDRASELPLTISFSEFDQILLQNPQIPLLDVRTLPEFQEGHAPKAKLFPLGELTQVTLQNLDRIPFSKDQTLYVICRSGNRSLQAVRILRSLGFSKAVSVDGGMIAWSQKGRPVSKD